MNQDQRPIDTMKKPHLQPSGYSTLDMSWQCDYLGWRGFARTAKEAYDLLTDKSLRGTSHQSEGAKP